jgi:multicomponent K+:H+ antiporter subunit F
MMTAAVTVALGAFSAAFLLCLWRLVRGPDSIDRVLALDTLYINAIAIIMLLGIAQDTTLYFEAALLIAAVGFVSTVALAKYLARDPVIE